MTVLLMRFRSWPARRRGTPLRRTAKTASYAVMHLLVAMAVAFALTRDWRAALAIGLVEPVVQTIAYALHERAWAQREGSGAAGAAHQGASAP
ncbi:MAG: DUF2061 domain-containing protein [Oceanicaulis sp.]